MTTVAVASQPGLPWTRPHGLWLGAIAVTLAIYLLRDHLPWADAYPKDGFIPLQRWCSQAMALMKDILFPITRAITAILGAPLQLAYGLLERGFTFGSGESAFRIPPLSWVGVVASVAIWGYAYGGIRIAALGAIGFLYLALFGEWTSSMRTLALVINCVPLSIAIGLMLGIAGFRWPRLNKALIVPLLDLAQAVPAYAYLVPMLYFFGTNPVAGLIATLVYATPPMVRATTLALSQVPNEISDFGTMAGCTRRQHMWRILVPSARPLIMVGVNQVIMATLNMVIISSMIGALGLGYDVLLALRALKQGAALEAGLAIVILAIVLDRISKAMAERSPRPHIRNQGFWQRHPLLCLALGILAVTTLLSAVVPELTVLPKSMTMSTGTYLDQVVSAVNKSFHDQIELVRVFLVLYVLKPIKTFLLALPWLGVIMLLAVGGLQLGGWRLALLVVSLATFCAVSGLWDMTMITVYLVGISAFFACAVGIPLGIAAARNDAVDRILTVVVDFLQTVPPFNYLIPAVILLGVGDVAAMLGIVLYSMTCAIRYTTHGIRQVPPNLIEAARASGCTRLQLLWRVQMPLALPEIMLGVNQVLMFALAMDIYAAMIGTTDLGQEVLKALAKADVGRGIVGGLAVACIGIIADRLIHAWSARVKQRYGLA